jgi:hypothetical protein
MEKDRSNTQSMRSALKAALWALVAEILSSDEQGCLFNLGTL